MLNAETVFHTLRRYETRLNRLLPPECIDDVLQEIRIILLQYDGKEAFRQSAVAVRRLLRNLGFARKSWQVAEFSDDVQQKKLLYQQLSASHREIVKHIENLYVNQGLTAKEVCEHLGVKWTPEIAKLLCQSFPKRMGKGGRRKGAGRKKKKTLV